MIFWDSNSAIDSVNNSTINMTINDFSVEDSANDFSVEDS